MKHVTAAGFVSLLVSSVILCAHGGRAQTTESIPAKLPAKTVPPTLFGMHIHRASSTTPWPGIPFSALRLWDSESSWRSLEPRRGEWHFEKLDRIVALCHEHHVDVLLTLGSTPTWASSRPNELPPHEPSSKFGAAAEPKDIEDWRNYVTTVGKRYAGRIQAYEIWNEPNLKQFYSGSVDQMVTLTREATAILKRIDPSVTIVSPSATLDKGIPWLSEFLQKGGGRFVDVIGYHFYVYPDPPERMSGLIEQVTNAKNLNGAGNKELWNTESGWSKPKTFDSGDEAGAFVARSYLLNWSAGVKRLYWYAWDNHDWVTLYMTESDDTTPTAAARAYARLESWMIGKHLEYCSPDSNRTWTCALRSPGSSEWILWNPYKPIQAALPRLAGTARRLRAMTLSGEQSVIDGNSLQVGPSPILIAAAN